MKERTVTYDIGSLRKAEDKDILRMREQGGKAFEKQMEEFYPIFILSNKD